jgi:hypothetical protein
MAYPLLSNPLKHYYPTRNKPILGIVLHVTAGAQDLGMVGTDGSAEATVRYGQTVTRAASWHGIVDTDTIIDCLPDSYTAFHVVGYNSPTLGLEIANLDARWDNKPAAWVEATLRNAAEWCRARMAKYGLPINLASKAEVDAAIKVGQQFGFTYHSYLDEDRRKDPGKTFPWARFAQLLQGEEDDDVGLSYQETKNAVAETLDKSEQAQAAIKRTVHAMEFGRTGISFGVLGERLARFLENPPVAGGVTISDEQLERVLRKMFSSLGVS